MEQKVRALGVVVGEKRKGLRNQLKSWWGSGSKSGKERDGVVMKDGIVIQYRNNSIEFQIMQLADFQFLLRDYENALQHYKMALVDFKADNSLAYMAATSEMIFYCLCVLGHGRREAELYSESANQFYMGRSPDSSPLLGARLALINSASLLARGNFNDAAGALVAYSDEAGPGTHARIVSDAFKGSVLPTLLEDDAGTLLEVLARRSHYLAKRCIYLHLHNGLKNVFKSSSLLGPFNLFIIFSGLLILAAAFTTASCLLDHQALGSRRHSSL